MADKVSPRDGKHVARVGTYDPMPHDGKKYVSLDVQQIRYWLACGALPSEPVANLLGKAGILPPAPQRKSQPKAKNEEDE